MSQPSVKVDEFTVAGMVFVIAGGLVAAATGPLNWSKGSWLSAFMVLVCGVALIAIGIAQQHSTEPVPRRTRLVQLGGWLLANGLVAVGALVDIAALTAIGSILLLAILLLTAWVGLNLVRTRHAWAYVYVAILLVLAVSAPIGMALSVR
ncbi:MAG: hypothetical protein WBA98_13325 [Gordonia sp. (in: high G+C Gram-positive bacteria)]|uniref:hypothetical protein n=1 Tax=Gordonia sp. (in: high G+C Gram-positive bacteria) TaxID=84139 RepID=UPI003C7701C5